MMKFAIFGAGAIGCYIGGHLLAAGRPVTFIGRKTTGDEISRHALTLSDHEGHTISIPADRIVWKTGPAGIRGSDVVILCTKSLDTENSIRQMTPHLDRKALIVSLQNGVENIEKIHELLPDRDVAGGIVAFNVLAQDKGRYHRATDGEVILQKNERLGLLERDLTGAGLSVRTTGNFKGAQWSKLLLNLNNGINVLAGVPLVEQLADRDYRLVLAACMKEAIVAAKSAGIVLEKIGRVGPEISVRLLLLPDFLFAIVLRRVMAMDRTARSSMWDDLQRGRKPEVDYLNGAVVRTANAHGLPAPVNARIVELVQEAFRNGRSPGLSGKALRDETGLQ